MTDAKDLQTFVKKLEDFVRPGTTGGAGNFKRKGAVRPPVYSNSPVVITSCAHGLKEGENVNVPPVPMTGKQRFRAWLRKPWRWPPKEWGGFQGNGRVTSVTPNTFKLK